MYPFNQSVNRCQKINPLPINNNKPNMNRKRFSIKTNRKVFRAAEKLKIKTFYK